MLRIRKLVLAMAAASALSSGMANALGLGELTLKSAQNQPLDAEIELLDVRDLTAAEVAPSLAPPEEFSKADILIGTAVGVGLAIVMTFETNGIALTSATNAGLIISLSIIFTPILEGFARKFWLPKNFFIAAVGAVVGVGFLVGGNGLHAPNWAAYSPMEVGRWRQRFSG